MFEADSLIAIVREWVAKAENDLKNAAYTLGMGEECPTDTVCFHAQQCVEKYLKAILVLERVDFPKTHNIDDLFLSVSQLARPTLRPDERARLTDYACATRYPGDYESISLDEAREAVKLARRVRKEVRKLLPKEAKMKPDLMSRKRKPESTD